VSAPPITRAVSLPAPRAGRSRLAVQAIQTRDYPLLQGCILVIALSYVPVNLLTDIVYALVDPRVRLS
jgi:ABC-type dipeptide/oligopeptide/nickel transport system permease component